MKAIVFTRYGPPEVLQLKEVEKPIPKDNEVLVQVCASSVNPYDYHSMRASPFLVRLILGFTRPKYGGLGADVAGRVEAVGRGVTRFHPGDQVFGRCAGGFAEYTAVPEDDLVLKPANVSFDLAAAAPMAALTALKGLRDQGKIRPGQKVLINGASGGVGTFAVQIAKALGAEVTGVCSARNLDLVRSIGADHVIDYTREDFGRSGLRYDLILSAVPDLKRSISSFKRALNPDGICVIVGLSTMRQLFRALLVGGWVSRTGSRKIGVMMMRPDLKDLLVVQELLGAGKVVPVIDRRYTLAEVPDAVRYIEEGHARGKVVVSVNQEAPRNP